jgi:hypothetical protein
MTPHEEVLNRFSVLTSQAFSVRVGCVAELGAKAPITELGAAHGWATSTLAFLESVFGKDSPYVEGFRRGYQNFNGLLGEFDVCESILKSASDDYSAGYLTSLQTLLSGEILGDFVRLAKQALTEGHHHVAAVLACAALEDALKRYAAKEGLKVQGKTMADVVGMLKGKGLVGGAQKTLLDTMPAVRNMALHAEWQKLQPADVSSVIGFVEQFLVSKFS